MVTVIGYAYDEALHCPACALADYENGLLDMNRQRRHFALDENGLPEKLTDRWRNPVRAVRSTSEPGEGGDYCDRCFTNLRTGEIAGGWLASRTEIASEEPA